MANQIYTHQIFSSYDMKVDFVMYEPTMQVKNNTYQLSYNPFLSFQWINHSGNQVQGSTFTVVQRNLYSVIEFFNTIYTWFFDKSKDDLFVIDDTNHLMFNSDYKDLNALIEFKRMNGGANILKAIPILLNNPLNEEQEGIYLYINQDRFIAKLTKTEIGTLLSALKTFSFYGEITTALTIVEYGKHNNITPTYSDMPRKTPFDV